MKSRILRAIVLLVALASQAGAGYVIWTIELGLAAERSSADLFERHARTMTLGLADLRAAFQAYVADGQPPAAWQKAAAGLLESATAGGRALRAAARSPEAQGAIENAVELIASLTATDTRAREYLASGQRLSASDVVFGEAASVTRKASDAIDVARGQEAITVAGALEHLRLQQLYVLGAAAAVTLFALLLLVPVSRASADSGDEIAAEMAAHRAGSGLGLSQPSPSAPRVKAPPSPDDDWRPEAEVFADLPPRLSETHELADAPPPPGIDLAGAAEVCAALARVQEPRELPALLERAAAVLGAAGIVIWMPDGPQGALRPALAHGYTPLAVTRMGVIPTDAENATALAFRAQTTQVVPSEHGISGAVAAPLVTADGCSGVMAAELATAGRPDQVHAVATIIAAQLATLISPGQPAAEGPGR